MKRIFRKIGKMEKLGEIFRKFFIVFFICTIICGCCFIISASYNKVYLGYFLVSVLLLCIFISIIYCVAKSVEKIDMKLEIAMCIIVVVLTFVLRWLAIYILKTSFCPFMIRTGYWNYLLVVTLCILCYFIARKMNNKYIDWLFMLSR